MTAGGDGRGLWTRGMSWWLAGLVVAGPVIVLFVLGLCFEVVPDLVWGISHHWTAVYRGERFRVPFGWRQVETPAGEDGVELRNAMHLRLGFSDVDWMSLRVAERRFDAVLQEVRSDRRQTSLLTPGDTLEPAPADGVLGGRYLCTDMLRMREGEIRVSCFDRGGRWMVSAGGHRGVIRDLAATVRGLPTIGRAASR